ncbi:4'-phosphopantetheinyl transferase family protein [Paenibacillus methanolicus]|uniref:4'-phosphopantetheinyl transferase superfamily protein n=1 Tax=Paenibacillus methanolicus TaxID=582686 RepID=A0A5S5CG89_9BACL|nr:4'-phosphopantetheinyl transferase superfamily protein [Paenibacillus methanolicus]TYP78149.1 4'-phosphopantetheinyl transferase superfamily protein [Paenibacillus methanolicus]
MFSFGDENAVAICMAKAGVWPAAGPLLASLHPEERLYWDQLKADKRKTAYLLGRHAAKLAAGCIAPTIPLDRMLIRPGLFQQPVLIHPELANRQVSISHTDRLAACLAFPEMVPAGIDIEEMLSEERSELVKSYLMPGELELATAAGLPFREAATLLWTAKESLSKCLRTGLTTPLSVYEIDRVERAGRWIVGGFANFPQYRAFSWLFREAAMSIVLPINCEHEPPDLYRLLEPDWTWRDGEHGSLDREC